jgi:hypothetical protein
MKLNDAEIVNKILNGIQYSSMKEFIPALLNTKNLVAYFYVNTSLISSRSVQLTIDNDWIIASTQMQFALSKSESVESFIVQIKQPNSNVVILESITPVSEIIPDGDVNTNLYFCVTNASPYNTLRKQIPDSRFSPLGTSKYKQIILDDQPSLNYASKIEVDSGLI